MSKIFVFLADGFEEIEAIAIIDVLRRAELDTTTVSISKQFLVKGAHNISVQADILFEDLDPLMGTMLVLPGGMPGTKNLDAHNGLQRLIMEYYGKGKRIAAICAAPMILGKLNLLRNSEATCYPGYEEYLTDAILSKNRVAESGRIITSKGPGSAIEFALKIVETMSDTETAKRIAKAMIVNI